MWTFGQASVIGSAHEKSGLPCQDHTAVKEIRLPSGEHILIACASDGAGSAKHSQVGSKIVCLSFIEAVEDWFATKTDFVDYQFFADWLRKCNYAIEINARVYGASPKEFSATALTAVLGQKMSAFFQIGDGAIVVDSIELDDAEIFSLTNPPDWNEYVNTTTFVTSSDSLRKAYAAIYPLAIDKIAIFTDGIEHGVIVDKLQEAYQPFFTKSFSAIKPTWSSRKASDWVNKILLNKHVNSFSDDDKSLILAVRDSNV